MRRIAVLQIEPCPARYDTATDDLCPLGPRIRSEWDRAIGNCIAILLYCISRYYFELRSAGKYRPVRDQRPLSTRIVFHLVHSRLQMRTFSSISMLWSRATIVQIKETNRNYSCNRIYFSYMYHFMARSVFYFIFLFFNGF